MWPWCTYLLWCIYQCYSILDSNASVYVWFLMFVCMCDAYVLDPDTCDHDAHTYYSFIDDHRSWYMHVWCIYQLSLILDCDACVYNAHIYDLVPWSWSMHLCMMHDVFLIRDTDTCIYLCSLILDSRIKFNVLKIWQRQNSLLHLIWCIFSAGYF